MSLTLPRSKERGLIEANWYVEWVKRGLVLPRSKERGLNMNKKPTSQRVYRDLTPDERQRVEVARDETDATKDEILAEGRLRKMAWLATQREVRRTVDALKTQRARLGLSLADVEARCGLKRSSLSRLENDPNANPTLLTLQRYAAALDMTLATTVEPI